jgi:anti-sigma factor RsiW
MNCKTVQSHLSAYLDRELSGEEMLDIRAHLSECFVCCEEETELRSLKRLLGRLPAIEPSGDLEQRLLAVVGAARTGERKPGRQAPFVLFAGVTACAMAITLAFLSKSHTTPAEATMQSQDIAFEAQRIHDYTGGGDAYGAPIVSAASYAGR